MHPETIQQILLVRRPKGMPVEEDFKFDQAPMPKPVLNEVLLKTLYVSVDPYMRGRMSDRKSYVPPFQLDEVIKGGVISEVIASQTPEFSEGDLVIGNLGWRTYQTAHEDELRKIDEKLAPITTHLGVLGMPGLTAYFGLLDIGQPKVNETVVVSGAAGAVGSVVGQIAKIKGARAVGIAGTQEKLDFLKNDLGFDEAINYKDGDFYEQLKQTCPNGVDVYYDNVGGEVSDAVLRMINHGARIPLCGQISLYNLEKPDIGPRVQSQLLINSALMKGFIVSDYAKEFQEAEQILAKWVQDGKIKYRETIVEGFDNIIQAFLGLFEGDNIGKYLVKIADQSK
ncbi:hypothetical protein EV207_11929 [Scopulibacillus darangshiensis]|uniref:Enoyl reductase (ER) domain-containing protein n=1 Tax=Scopulibacillus darangshiensis TaxID=442528 RepID=A0A4R2NY03_9BACL|nr:NADP-dependent oxidoreductase [Scopulibacillus darangshiensis]TCP26598.1 hypothetical protein EV207_11929 [Scopulibacillus darangshiensis]